MQGILMIVELPSRPQLFYKSNTQSSLPLQWVSHLQNAFQCPSSCVVSCFPSRDLFQKNMSGVPDCFLDLHAPQQYMCLVYTVAYSPCRRVFLATTSKWPSSWLTWPASTSRNKCLSPICYTIAIPYHNCDNDICTIDINIDVGSQWQNMQSSVHQTLPTNASLHIVLLS